MKYFITFLLLYSGCSYAHFPHIAGPVFKYRPYRNIIPSYVTYANKRTSNGDASQLKFAQKIFASRATRNAANNESIDFISGDVFLRDGVVHMYDSSPTTDFVLNDWLHILAPTKKAIIVNVYDQLAVKAVVDTIFMAKRNIRSPISLNAMVLKGPGHNEDHYLPISSKLFFEEFETKLREATLSVGWTGQPLFLDNGPYKYRWRDIISMIELTQGLECPVNYVVRPAFVYDPIPILWLVTSRTDGTLTLYSTDVDIRHSNLLPEIYETVKHSLLVLRLSLSKNRVFYNLSPKPEVYSSPIYDEISHSHATLKELLWHDGVPLHYQKVFDRHKWRAVIFTGRSGGGAVSVVKTDYGVIFMGKPIGVLVSEKSYLTQPLNQPHSQSQYSRYNTSGVAVGRQSISGLVQFLHRSRRRRTLNDLPGLVIELLPAMNDYSISDTTKGVHVFIGASGRISVEDRSQGVMSSQTNSIITVIEPFPCYAFTVEDTNNRVVLTVEASVGCDGDQLPPIPSGQQGSRLSLDVTPINSRHMRYVVMSKTGEKETDLIVQHLVHSDATFLISNYYNYVIGIFFVICNLYNS